MNIDKLKAPSAWKLATPTEWKLALDYYMALAVKSANNPGVRLAFRVLADYCLYELTADRGGPALEMVQLAEGIVGPFHCPAVYEVLAGEGITSQG